MKQRNSRRWMCALLLAGFCVVITALAFPALLRGFAAFFVGVGLALGGAGFVVAWFYLRCPHCRALLPIWEDWTAHCPRCGRPADGEETQT